VSASGKKPRKIAGVACTRRHQAQESGPYGRAFLNRALAFASLIAVLGLAGCGGSSSTKAPPSGLTKRVFVSNAFAQVGGVSSSDIEVIDATKDTLVTSVGASIFLNPGCTRMRLTADKTKTLLYDTSQHNFHVVDNSTESISFSLPTSGALPAASDDFVILPDNTTVLASARNAPVPGEPSGEVVVLSLLQGSITDTIPVPHVTRLALSPDGKKLLAFPDDMNSLWVIDTTAKTATRVDGFDRPTWGVFSSDGSKAYILSCGPECGGAASSVTVLDMASNAKGSTIPVSAATIALLNGNNLFVAGSAGGQGKLDIIDTGTLTAAHSGLPIGNGFHTLMTIGANNKLLIGAQTCTGGCLSIVDTTSLNTVISTEPGDVTGMQPIPDRSVVYVVEGGELVIYDTTTSQPQSTQIDIVGQASDVVYPD
jgi:hypothetical protein